MAGAALATPPPAIEIAATGGAWARAPVSLTYQSDWKVCFEVVQFSVQVAAGTRFGPFLGKWVLEPQREEHAWEVSEKSLKPDYNRISA